MHSDKLPKQIILVNPSPGAGMNGFTNTGLASIESFLTCHDISCETVNVPQEDSSRLEKYINHSDVFAFSVMDQSYRLAENLTKQLQHKTVIWGGWTATASPEFILKQNPGVDYIIMREGEKRLLNLLEAFRKPDLFDRIDGLAYRNGQGGIVVRPPEEFLDMNELSIPTDLATLQDQRTVFIELSRGCYGRCRYCQDVHKMRFKSAQKAAEEIEYWYARDWKTFYVGDANSLANGKLLRKLIHEIELRALKISLILVGRPEDVLRNYDILESIFTSRFIELKALEIGIEANTQRQLDLLGRGTTPEINREAMEALLGLKAAHSSHIHILANMILFAHFDMTLDDFVENVRFIGKYQCSRPVMSSHLQGIAGTPIWHDMKARGFLEMEHLGLQIVSYPFSDENINKLFNKLSYLAYQQYRAQRKSSSPRTLFQVRQQFFYDKVCEFYQAADIKESIMDFILQD